MQKIDAVTYFPMSTFTTLNEMLTRTVSEHADQTAVVYREKADDVAIRKTYRELEQDMEGLKQALYSLDQRVGRRIAVVGENSYPWMLAYLSTVTALGTVIPLDRLLQADEMIGLLERAEADTLVVDVSIYLKLLEDNALSVLENLRHVVLMLPERLNKKEQIRYVETKQTAPAAIAVHEFDSLLDAGLTIDSSNSKSYFPLPDPAASTILIFTSGTTSNAKGVLLSHRSLCSNLRGLEGMVRFPDAVRLLSVLPLNHAFENTCGLLFALNIGAEIYVCDGLRYVQQNMQEYKTQMLIGVPNLFDAFYKKILLKAKKSGSVKKMNIAIRLSRILRKVGIDVRRKLFSEIHEAFGGELAYAIVGAAAMKTEVGAFFEDIGVRIMQGYGLTETSPVVAGCNTQLLVNGSVGVPLTGVEVAVDTDVDGEPGEILVRGDLLMNGYYRDPEATAEVIDRDGWFHTGDLGQIDPKTNTLSIRGRLKSMIVLANGKKVFPEEIEQLISEKAAAFVKDTLVFSHPDEKGETIITAKFVLDKEALEALAVNEDHSKIQEMLENLLQEVNQLIPQFKRIQSHFYSFHDMIRTTTLKVKRNAEVEKILLFMQKSGLDWRKLRGINLDQFDDVILQS